MKLWLPEKIFNWHPFLIEIDSTSKPRAVVPFTNDSPSDNFLIPSLPSQFSSSNKMQLAFEWRKKISSQRSSSLLSRFSYVRIKCERVFKLYIQLKWQVRRKLIEMSLNSEVLYEKVYWPFPLQPFAVFDVSITKTKTALSFIADMALVKYSLSDIEIVF